MSLRVPLRAVAATLAMLALGACSGNLSSVTRSDPPPQQQAQPGGPGAPVRVGLILPMTAPGNAGRAAESMKNAAEMALAEFSNPNVQLIVKDDGGSPGGAQAAAQAAIDEGAEIVLGPLFAQSVSAAGQVARSRGLPVIAFSTDSTVARGGVYLLSFLPESDVDRVISYALAQGKRNIVALLPDNAYGSVVEAEFKTVMARRGGRILALERYPLDKLRMQEPIRKVAGAVSQADAVFIPDGADAVPLVVQGLAAAGAPIKKVQLIGTGLWDDPRIFADPMLQGGWFAAPDGQGFRGFANRYRTRYGNDPVRTATLAYDAVSLTAALVKNQGTEKITDQVLTSGTGFSGIEGIFRFKPDGTNERGLAVLKVTTGGPEVVSAAPRTFTAGTNAGG